MIGVLSLDLVAKLSLAQVIWRAASKAQSYVTGVPNTMSCASRWDPKEQSEVHSARSKWGAVIVQNSRVYLPMSSACQSFLLGSHCLLLKLETNNPNPNTDEQLNAARTPRG